MFTARFPIEVESSLAQYAAQLGMSKSALALRAVQDFLQRKPLPVKAPTAVSTEQTRPLTPSERMAAVHAHIAKHSPIPEPNLDWKAMRDAGRKY